MATKIKLICLEIIEKCVEEVKEEHNMNKIKSEILDPCVAYILKKLYPYIMATCIIFVLIFLMSSAILVILIFNKSISTKNTNSFINLT